MELILHLGAHRTGSTALSRCLTGASAMLAAEGVAIWPPTVLRATPGYANAPGLAVFARLGDRQSASSFRRLRQTLASRIMAENAQRLLISEENMIGSMYENLTERVLYPLIHHRLSAFAALLPAAPVRIGLGLRDYASLWRSAYLYVLPRQPLPRFEAVAAELVAMPRGWVDVVQDIAAIFPQARILLWQHRDLAQAMTDIAAALIGRESTAGLRQVRERVNAAGNGSDYDLIHHVRQSEPDLVGAGLSARCGALRGLMASSPPQFADRDVAAMDARYADDLGRLAALGPNVRLISGKAVA